MAVMSEDDMIQKKLVEEIGRFILQLKFQRVKIKEELFIRVNIRKLNRISSTK